MYCRSIIIQISRGHYMITMNPIRYCKDLSYYIGSKCIMTIIYHFYLLLYLSESHTFTHIIHILYNMHWYIFKKVYIFYEYRALMLPNNKMDVRGKLHHCYRYICVFTVSSLQYPCLSILVVALIPYLYSNISVYRLMSGIWNMYIAGFRIAGQIYNSIYIVKYIFMM